MNINVLQNIIKSGEKIDTEFKEAVNKLPKNLFETICAFLNRFGGNIFLGISDSKKIVGVDKNNVVKIKKEFATLCNNTEVIFPTVYLEIEEYELDGKTILYIRVPDSSEVHRYKGKIYDRNEDGDFDITNSVSLVTDMYIRKRNIHVEDRIFPYATIENDIRPDLIEKARRLAKAKNSSHPWLNMSDEEIIKSCGLYIEDKVSRQQGLTLAAILLFGTDEAIMSCLPSFKTDAIYREHDMLRYDDREVVITNLIDSYFRLMAFVQKHTNDPFYLEDTHVVSIRDTIARELCVNLLIHRELSSGYTSRIIITKDSIYTENPTIPRNRGFITLENCIPFQKNPKIAKVFREMGLADELGSGIRNMTYYLNIYFGNKPILEDGQLFKTTISLNKRTENGNKKNAVNESLENENKTTIFEEIIEFCQVGRSAKEISHYFGFKDIKNFKKNYINKLILSGKLKMTLPDKPTSKNQKYIS